MFNGTWKKSASLVGTAPSLDALCFTKTVKSSHGAKKQFLLAAK